MKEDFFLILKRLDTIFWGKSEARLRSDSKIDDDLRFRYALHNSSQQSAKGGSIGVRPIRLHLVIILNLST